MLTAYVNNWSISLGFSLGSGCFFFFFFLIFGWWAWLLVWFGLGFSCAFFFFFWGGGFFGGGGGEGFVFYFLPFLCSMLFILLWLCA